MSSMNKLPPEKRAQILGMMVEGNSIRGDFSHERGQQEHDRQTAGGCRPRLNAAYQDYTLRGVCRSQRIQVDEIWAFVYAKQKNLPESMKGRGGDGVGDVWTWTAINADSKLDCVLARCRPQRRRMRLKSSWTTWRAASCVTACN